MPTSILAGLALDSSVTTMSGKIPSPVTAAQSTGASGMPVYLVGTGIINGKGVNNYGTIAALNATVTTNSDGFSTSFSVVIKGSASAFTGTIVVQCSDTGTGYAAVPVTWSDQFVPSTSRAFSGFVGASNTIIGTVQLPAYAGFIQVICSAYTSGSITAGTYALSNGNPQSPQAAFGAAATGSAVVGNPVLMGGSDVGGLARPLLTDTNGRQIAVGAAAAGAAISGNPVLMAGSDGTNVRALLTDNTGILQVDPYFTTHSQFPGYTPTAPGTTLASVDSNGNLIVRASVLSDEGSFRYSADGTTLGYSQGSATISGLVVTGTFSNVQVYDYFKFDADTDSAWVQVVATTSTALTLAGAYTGASSGACSTSKLLPKIGTTYSYSAATGALIVTTGVPASGQMASFLRFTDYGPLIHRSRYSVANLQTNGPSYIGLFGSNPNGSFALTNAFSCFVFDGTGTTAQVKCVSGRNWGAAVSATYQESTTITLPGGALITALNDYRVEALKDGVYFYINDVLVAKNTLRIPTMSDSLWTGFMQPTIGTVTTNTHTIAMISVLNHNEPLVGFMNAENKIIPKLGANAPSITGTLSSLNASLSTPLPPGCTAVKVFSRTSGVGIGSNLNAGNSLGEAMNYNLFEVSPDNGTTWFAAMAQVTPIDSSTQPSSIRSGYTGSRYCSLDDVAALVDVTGSTHFRVYNCFYGNTYSTAITIVPLSAAVSAVFSQAQNTSAPQRPSTATLSSLNTFFSFDVPEGMSYAKFYILATSSTTGVFQFQTSINNGATWTVAKSLLSPVSTPSNITDCTSGLSYTNWAADAMVNVDCGGASQVRIIATTGVSTANPQFYVTFARNPPLIVPALTSAGIQTTANTTLNNLQVSGAVAAGSAIGTQNPLMIGGSDATNVRAFLTTTSGVLNVQVAGSTGTALLPAAAATADAFANPTTTNIVALTEQFNGSTWDRERNNANVVMGDTGAKVSSFNGAAQTNYNAEGAKIMVLCGAVTGTTPTLTAQLQISPDGGTTWLNYGPASGTATATGNTILIDIAPTNQSVSGATPSALTTGATQTVQINGTLPRTWRLAYVITGTTPSFTLTNAYVAYTL